MAEFRLSPAAQGSSTTAFAFGLLAELGWQTLSAQLFAFVARLRRARGWVPPQ